MKKGNLKTDWLAPLVGITVVGGSLMAATTYVNLEQKTSDAKALTVTLDHLYQDQRLSAALRSLRGGQVETAAQRVDQLLCEDILRRNAELGSADAPTRAYVNDMFRRIALLRPKVSAGASGGAAQECTEDQIAAERILAHALGKEHIAQNP